MILFFCLLRRALFLLFILPANLTRVELIDNRRKVVHIYYKIYLAIMALLLFNQV